jgi:anti-sigma regulatory factor (Ser/Thr protein kinase)
MEALLTSGGVEIAAPIAIRDEASLTLARSHVAEVAAQAGVDAEMSARAALVATELARNQLRHAMRGWVGVVAIDRPRADGDGAHRGLEIIAADGGSGIADPRSALLGVPRIAGSLGVGLAMVRENALELDVDVRIGEGSCVRARVFDRATPRWREVGIYGRPFPGEPRSGDLGYFWRNDALLFAAVCDGLGHGPLAREAAEAAIGALRSQGARGPAELLDGCHSAMHPTRGAVMAIATVDDTISAFETASIGNVAVQLAAHRRSQRFGGSSAVLGARTGLVRARSETCSIEPLDVLVMMSDGIKTQIALEEEPELLREHPIVIAHEIVTRFGRSNDDALVLVAR